MSDTDISPDRMEIIRRLAEEEFEHGDAVEHAYCLQDWMQTLLEGYDKVKAERDWLFEGMKLASRLIVNLSLQEEQ